jgi:hypothetical protein
MKFEDIKIILDKFENITIDYNKIENEIILKKIKNNWDYIIGNHLNNFAYPKKIENNILHIGVQNSTYKMELSFIINLILINLRNLTDGKINKVKFIIDPIFKFKNINSKVIIKKEINPNLYKLVEKEEDKKIQKILIDLINVF